MIENKIQCIKYTHRKKNVVHISNLHTHKLLFFFFFWEKKRFEKDTRLSFNNNKMKKKTFSLKFLLLKLNIEKKIWTYSFVIRCRRKKHCHKKVIATCVLAAKQPSQKVNRQFNRSEYINKIKERRKQKFVSKALLKRN